MNPIFTVSEVVHDVRSNLETLYADVWIKGEISNCNRHSSGHCYFTLKDAGAQLSAVMFRDDLSRLKFVPEMGLQVVVRGRLTVYPPQGRFQLVASAMEPQGKGGLQLAFEQLKAKLDKEGLFDPKRKKPIPALPQWVGVLTSLDGAALHDILSILDRRFSTLRILIAPVRVQGEGSAADIAKTIRYLNKEYPSIDVLLVGRGGGSIEDLWAFNEEIVARAIADSKIPIISCVGHETDVTIADFVADLRAPTPSAAAELVISAKSDLIDRLQSLLSRQEMAILSPLESFDHRLRHALASPILKRPAVMIEDRLQDVDRLQERLRQFIRYRMDGLSKDFEHVMQKLHLLSPLATLARGYSITWKLPSKTLVKSAKTLEPNDQIEVQLPEGRAYAQVQRTDI